jgi:hypothetical protein
MGVGSGLKTKSAVRYKIPLLDTWGRTVVVTAYAMEHIMTHMEEINTSLVRAIFPEVQSDGLVTASGKIGLLVGQDNLSLFPVEQSRVGNAAQSLWYGMGSLWQTTQPWRPGRGGASRSMGRHGS